MTSRDLNYWEAARLVCGGQSVEEVAKAYSCRPSTVLKRLTAARAAGLHVPHRSHKRAQKHSDYEILELKRAGKTPTEIADMLGYKVKTVYVRLRELEYGESLTGCAHRKSDADCDTCPYPDCVATDSQIRAWGDPHVC